MAAAGAMALAAGGSVVDALKAIGFAFLSMNVWTEVGNFLHPIVNAAGVAGQAISTVTHAVVGGALSVAQGGSFLEGFASAGLGSVGGFAGADIVGNNPDGLFVRTAFAATAGGLASELTGGKFANGAITASFAHLFNDEDVLGRYTNPCDNNVHCTPLQRAQIAAKAGGTGSSEFFEEVSEEAAAGLEFAEKALGIDANAGGSQIDRSVFQGERRAYWQAEAQNNPGSYSEADLARMQSGKAPIGSDGYPMELHHVDGTPNGGLEPMTRTDHRLGDNYLTNHPWLRK